VGGALAAFNLGAPLALLVVGAHAVMSHDLTLGQMLGFNVIAVSFLGPLAALLGQVQSFQLIGIHLDRLHEVFAAKPERAGGREPECAETGSEIRLEAVSFRYSGRSPWAVREVNLTITPGALVALVGPSGSGKSTLAKLILGLYDPTIGRILVNGEDISSLDVQRLRRRSGVVLQDSFLFNDTIADNIALVAPSASLAQIHRAAAAAEIDSDIRAMPMGYDTKLSEMGNNISGGQRQRICLARALVGDPRLLVLDEATSDLDAATEQRVQCNLAARGSTRIVVTHRLTAVTRADLIVVLREGRIAEQGTHLELLSKGGYYSRMVKRQDQPAAQPGDHPQTSVRPAEPGSLRMPDPDA
jgi:ABC-type bacteriocin/lantibiotic exporter with double-glycine peptidase domain